MKRYQGLAGFLRVRRAPFIAILIGALGCGGPDEGSPPSNAEPAEEPLPAFTLTSPHRGGFDEFEIALDVSTESCKKIPLSPEKVMEYAVIGANRHWNRVPDAPLNFIRGNLVDIPTSGDPFSLPGKVGKNRILIGCNSVESSPSVVAVGFSFLRRIERRDPGYSPSTITLRNGTGEDEFYVAPPAGSPQPPRARQRDGVVLLNDQSRTHKLSERVWEDSIAHEIGHAMGLGHSPYSDCLMYYLASGPGELCRGDENGFRYLYPDM